MTYASLEDFDAIVHTLMHDEKKEPFATTVGTLTVTLSLLLRVYVLPDVPDELAMMIQEVSDVYADEIIRRYPFSEGYIDFLYGAAFMGRGGLWK